MTTFRSLPCGRGGTDGNSPALMRSVQSAYSVRRRFLPIRTAKLFIELPVWLDLMRRSHAAKDESNAPRFLGISRVALSPSWWHDSQASVFSISTHSAWLLIRSEIPFPLSPEPGKSLFGGICSSAYQ